MSVRCPICGDELPDEAALRAHDHAMPAPWENAGAGSECPECGRLFDEHEELVRHQATAHRGGSTTERPPA